ncbi:hypothetical protein YA0002_16935 [Pseudomonas cichorii]|uniref:hypothetical protein n=1 Tax=Pseudomonas cichorii TaxID=36746 RepID=UPI0018E5EB54|nr:hypothetical protein [Pseudomonas cichorii]MBI6854463.1 hypothetical protein [Pseudomonas cichorii]
MSIQTKDWYAHINNMPSLEGPKFMVSGVVTVTNSAIEATLVKNPRQDKSLGLRLDIQLEDKGVGLNVLTDKTVAYSQEGGSEITHVTIYHQDKKLAQIDKIEIAS